MSLSIYMTILGIRGNKMMRYLFVILLSFSFNSFAQNVLSFQFKSVGVNELCEAVLKNVLHVDYVISSDVLSSSSKLSMSVSSVPKDKIYSLFESVLNNSGFRLSRVDNVVFVDLSSKKSVSDSSPVVESRSVAPPAVVSPDSQKRFLVYRPRYRSAQYLKDVVLSLIGSGVVVSASGAAESVDKTVEPDQLALSVDKVNYQKVLDLLIDLDTDAGEVLLKAAIYEVGSIQSDGSALQLVGNILGGHVALSVGEKVKGGNSLTFKVSGLDAVLSALDSDSRFKNVSRPQVRVKSGAKASFTVGSDVPVLGASVLDRNGNAVQSVDYKSSGVIFTASPQVRADLIEVDLNQEVSGFVSTSTGVNTSPTLNKRAVSTRLTLRGGEVVVFGGLLANESSESSTALPILSWLLGESRTKKSTELVVLIEAQRI